MYGLEGTEKLSLQFKFPPKNQTFVKSKFFGGYKMRAYR